MSTATATAHAVSPDPAQMLVYRVVDVPRTALPVVVEEMIRAFDGRLNLLEVCDQAQISVAKGQAVVRKLTQMGVIEAVVRRPAPARTRANLSAFTPEEEAFFASEVEPIDECDEPFESVGEKVTLFVSDLILRLKGSPAY